MKFIDGYWMNAAPYTIHYIGSAYSWRRVEGGVELIATKDPIRHRGQTLGGPTLTVTVFSPQPNVIGVDYRHFADRPGAFSYPLHREDAFAPTVTVEGDVIALLSGDTRAEITVSRNQTDRTASPAPWSIRFYYKGRLLTENGWRTTAYIEESPAHARLRQTMETDDYPWSPKNPDRTYLRESLSLAVGECVYGLGERFTPFVKNGQSVDTWNADGGTCTGDSYKSVPFYVTSRGYGVFVDHPGNVSFAVASEVVNAVHFSVPGENLRYFVIGGDHLRETVSRYTALTGRPALPPAESFGLWLTTSFTTDYDEATVTSFIDGMAAREIPLSVFHFDCFWMEEFHWCDFAWDSRQFPDPAGMIERLHARGLKLCVWVNPYISAHSALFAEGVENGYFLRARDGGVYQSDQWQPGMAIVDFTNPAAAEWYGGKIRALCRMGVDYIKTDFGERIPSDCVYHNGADPTRMHNYYTYLYNETVFRAIEAIHGRGKACLFARSGTAGSQAFPVHWGGDCSAKYESMAETIRGGLSLSLSGFGFFSHDMAGFESTATPDIYKRWCAFGCLSTHSRLHGNSSYRVPWLFDEEACHVLRAFVHLKGRLMPYLYSMAAIAAEEGIPVTRPMVMEFPRERNLRTVDTQYMLGDALLVAPILNPDSRGEYYLPEGDWTEFFSGETERGGTWREKEYDYYSLPLYLRPASLFPTGDFHGDFTYRYWEGTHFTITALAEGESAAFRMYIEGTWHRITAVRQGGTIAVETDGDARRYGWTFRSVDGLAIRVL